MIPPAQRARNDRSERALPLAADHLADLRRSGLTDDTIRAAGLYSETDATVIGKLLHWRGPAYALGPCLAFPFRDAAGNVNGYLRVKPTRPRAKDGKPVKYESPVGQPNRAYIPPGTVAALADSAETLIVTEGEKKALAADQHGLPCVGLVGVYGWQRKRPRDADGKPHGDRELIDGLAAVAWQGRTVHLCFDSDAATNPHVGRAVWHLAEALRRRGATVRVVRLPAGDPGPDGTPAKIGLDDFIVAHGPDAFRELIAAAVEPTPPAKGSSPNEAADDPHRLARSFLDDYRDAGGRLLLRAWQAEFWHWREGAYRAVPSGDLRGRLVAAVKRDFDIAHRERMARLSQDDRGADGEGKKKGKGKSPKVQKVTAAVVSNALQAVASLALLPADTLPPAWIAGGGPDPRELVLCRNAIVNLPALVAGDARAIRPTTPDLFAMSAADIDFDPAAAEPAEWLHFLRELWPDDIAGVAALCEWFGYLLTPDTSQQKILLIVGPPRSGKGTIGRVLTGLLGAANVAGPTLGSLGTEFGLWPLIGKSAAIIADARLSGRNDLAAVTERLLSISGEDAQTVNRKNLPFVTMRLPTRFVILTNELPRIADASGALAGRFVVLRLRNTFYGREDRGLTARLLAELPGIMLWAVAGWQRLRERGRFVQPESALADISELEDLASPVKAFVRDRCATGEALSVKVQELYAAWKVWCEEGNKREPGTITTFGRDLRAAFPRVAVSQPREGDDRVRVYRGIALKTGPI